MKRLFSTLLIFIMCLSLVAPLPANAAPTKLSKAKAMMEVDSKLVLKIDGAADQITWSTNKVAVASVNSSGEVSAKSTGQATITATVDKKVIHVSLRLLIVMLIM